MGVEGGVQSLPAIAVGKEQGEVKVAAVCRRGHCGGHRAPAVKQRGIGNTSNFVAVSEDGFPPRPEQPGRGRLRAQKFRVFHRSAPEGSETPHLHLYVLSCACGHADAERSSTEHGRDLELAQALRDAKTHIGRGSGALALANREGQAELQQAAA